MATAAYQSGFGNEFATEAIAGTLPVGQNSPQKVAHGLYAEQISGTAFTAPRHANRRSWLYRIRPAALHGTFETPAHPHFHNRFEDAPTSPNQRENVPVVTREAKAFPWKNSKAKKPSALFDFMT